MEKHLSRRAFVATAGSAAVAAAGLAAWSAARREPAAQMPVSAEARAPAMARTELIDVEGWLLTAEDVRNLPDERVWVVETQ